MAMGAIYLTDASSGAPALSGTNGALCTVLDWALVQKGWAIEYTAANNRVYRPGAGNRNRLYVGHDSAVSGDARLATVRGCENASAAAVASLTNPFPTVAQQANGAASMLTSITANATARPYKIILTDRFLLMAVSCGSTNTTNWDMFAFGDLAGVDPLDTYATIMHNGSSSTATATNTRGLAGAMLPNYGRGKTFFCRTIDGTILSPYAVLYGSGPDFCAVANAQIMRGGYGNRIDREKMAVTCTGSNTVTVGVLAIMKRGWIPNLWNPIHTGIGSITSDDVWTDTAYASGSSFCILPASSTVAGIMETTDTWSPPSG